MKCWKWSFPLLAGWVVVGGAVVIIVAECCCCYCCFCCCCCVCVGLLLYLVFVVVVVISWWHIYFKNSLIWFIHCHLVLCGLVLLHGFFLPVLLLLVTEHRLSGLWFCEWTAVSSNRTCHTWCVIISALCIICVISTGSNNLCICSGISSWVCVSTGSNSYLCICSGIPLYVRPG